MYRSVGTIASDVECQWLGPKWPVWLEPKWPAQASNFVRKPGGSHRLRCGLQPAQLAAYEAVALWATAGGTAQLAAYETVALWATVGEEEAWQFALLVL